MRPSGSSQNYVLVIINENECKHYLINKKVDNYIDAFFNFYTLLKSILENSKINKKENPPDVFQFESF